MVELHWGWLAVFLMTTFFVGYVLGRTEGYSDGYRDGTGTRR